MNDKFTIRDFLVYFLTGLFLLLTLLYYFKNRLLDFFSIEIADLKDNSALFIFLLLPALYLLGHFIQGIDYLLFKIGRVIWDFKEKHKTRIKKIYMLWLFNFINFIINGYRITGRLNAKDIDPDQFWKDCIKLTNHAKYDKADYWNLMHALFEGLTFVSVCWTFYFLLYFSKQDFFISLIVAIVFWNRSKQMADNLITTVRNTISLIPKLPLT